MLSAVVGAGLKGGYLVNPMLAGVQLGRAICDLAGWLACRSGRSGACPAAGHDRTCRDQ
jgi:hypothetical protein